MPLQPSQLAQCCSRCQSVRCFSSFSFSQPTKRDKYSRRERQSQPLTQYREPRQQDAWQQQQQQQPRQQDRFPEQQQQHLRRGKQPVSNAERPYASYDHQYLITCHPGLEKVTAADLQQRCAEVGVTAEVEVTAPGRIALGSDTVAAGYAAVLHLRSATRVLQLIQQQQLDADLPAGQTVYEATRAAAAWPDLLLPHQTLGVHCLHFYNNSNVTNSQLVQRRVRDAVCDAVRDDRGTRPAPPQGSPDLPLAFQMLNDNLQIYRDVGGGSLHRRGYRADSAVHKAALNEAAAAGLMLLAGWQHSSAQQGAVCVDPMCGSGTLLIEAALIATATAPGLLRDTRANPWPFLHWPDFQRQQWSEITQAAQQRAQEGGAAWRAGGGRILGNDCHAGALKLAQQAAQSAGVSDLISLHRGECGHWELPRSDPPAPHLVVCNPPWGLRLMSGGPPEWEQQQDSRRYNGSSSRGSGRSPSDGSEGGDEGDLLDAWQQLSVFLKGQCAGAEAWVLSGNPEMSRHLGMRASSKKAVRLGGQKTMWLQYGIRGRH